MRHIRPLFILVLLVLFASVDGLAESVAVRHLGGLTHGFLVLRTLDGTRIADGDWTQIVRGARVTSRLVFHFTDGSLHDETTVYVQRRVFQFVSDHLVQKGPSFPQPLDMSIEAATGQVRVRYTDDHGKPKEDSEHVDLPPDLANGLIPALLENVRPQAPPVSFGFLAATPKPRLVKLAVRSAGEEAFSTGGLSHKATHYVLKVEIGGFAGKLAPLVGKQPPDSHVWILDGEAPAFVKAEEPLYSGGPVWRIELATPVWPRSGQEPR